MSIARDTEQSVRTRAVRAVREQTGLHEQLAAPVVDQIIDAIYQEFGRERVYFAPSKSSRNAAIRAEYDGKNWEEVRKRHGVSRATMYRVLGGKTTHKNANSDRA